MKNRIMLNPHSELPLKEDTSNLFLKIMIAVTVFLFAITLSAEMMINKAVLGWGKDISQALTVQIKPADKALTEEEENLRLNKVIQYFEQNVAVEKVTLINDRQMQRLMSPWLGKDLDLSTLPLPKLLDVRLKQDVVPDFNQMNEELKEIAPYTTIDNHRVWLSKLLKFTSALKTLSSVVLIMVLISSAYSIFYATQSSLGLHSQIIEILHVIGATDDYIARQYARRSLIMGLFSGLIGIGFAILAIVTIGKAAGSLDAGILAIPSLSVRDWLIICSLPLWAAVLSMLTAYGTVKRVLGKIM